MMYRYVTLVWDRRDAEAVKAAEFIAARLPESSPHKWAKAWGAEGIAVYHSGAYRGRMQTYRLQSDGGVVLGRLFRNAPNGQYVSQIADLDTGESEKCLKTKGQHLIDNYWGRYVTFLHEKASGSLYIMRDPSGAFPCFHAPYRGVEIYFSDMQDAANLDFLSFTINWDYLRTNILLPQFQKTHTGLNEVSEVLPAECLEITPFECKSRFVWNPWKIAETDVVEDVEEAAALLCKTVKNTIGALAGCYESIIHNLGGLDSSIVLACLAEAPDRPDITAINFYTVSPGGEERFYSRQAANATNVPLVERELDYRKADLSRIFLSNKLANPLGFFDCIGLTGDVLALAEEKGAQALFYGVGGDNVFFQPPLNLGALDYVRSCGFGGKTFQIAMEASRYGRISLSRTLRSMVRERLSGAPCRGYVHDLMFGGFDRPLLNPDFVSAGGEEKLLHPLLIPEDDAPKGKYLHILCCTLFSIEYYDHWDTAYTAERVHAYLTQPIVEACLRIPTWILTHGGLDRGLARKAFQSDLPRDVAKRRTKSTPGAYYREIYEYNIAFLQEILLDGNLVREKILLRDRLEKALTKKDHSLQISPGETLGYVAMEAWLRGWLERPKEPARHKDMAV